MTELTTEDLAAYRAAMSGMQGLSDDRGYQYYAGIHGLPLPIWCDQNGHGTPTFLHWHRAYLSRFELALRQAGGDVTVPWWDWTTTREVPSAFAEETTDDGSPNPLYSVPINHAALDQGRRGLGDDQAVPLSRQPNTARAPGTLPGGALPSAKDIQDLVENTPDFTRFTQQLEDFHGEVHVWVGGHMSDIPFAAYDPIFWSHHAMIDRIWRLWQMHHSDSIPPSLEPLVMQPFGFTAGGTIDMPSLGYEYALQVPIRGGIRVNTYQSGPIPLPTGHWSHADLVFYGVEHRGDSYVARIFFDKPNARASVSPRRTAGLAGRFVVFGHGGCFGDRGHCDPPPRPRDPFDLSPPHPLTPLTKVVPVTTALKRFRGESLIITVVALVASTETTMRRDILEFTGLRLVTYA